MRGWSSVYDRTAVPLPEAGDDPLDVVQIQRRAKGCLGYLVVGGQKADSAVDSDGSDHVAIAVDVSRHGDEWREAAAARDASIAAVLDTHVHADHLSGGRTLADELGYPLPPGGGRRARRGVRVRAARSQRDARCRRGQRESARDPGHTDDGASYLIGRSAVLTGDTLFTDSVGRTELQFAAGGDAAEDDAAGRRRGW